MIIGKCPVCGEDMRIGSDITNADRIRSMTDEELSSFLCSISICTGVNCLGMKYCNFDGNGYLDWLKEEVKDED